MKVLIVGSGAMAKFVGAKLFDHCSVAFLGNHISSSYQFHQNQTTQLINNYSIFDTTKGDFNDFDLIFWLTTTAYNQQYFEQFKNQLKLYKGVVLNFQNGVGFETFFITTFTSSLVFYGLTTQGVVKVSDGVKDTGSGSFLLPQKAADNQTVQNLIHQLNIEFVEDIDRVRYKKLSVNCIINPITAFLNIKNGAILTDRKAMSLVDKITKETLPFWQSINIYTTEKDYQATITLVAQQTALNESSMLSAKKNQIPLEIDAILNPVIKATQSETLIYLRSQLNLLLK